MTMLNFKCRPEFQQALDNYLRKYGGDRSDFIRRAIIEKLQRETKDAVDPKLSEAPSRIGKGGRKKLNSKDPAAGNPDKAQLPPYYVRKSGKSRPTAQGASQVKSAQPGSSTSPQEEPPKRHR